MDSAMLANVIAVLVSIVAAVFAWKSAGEAKIANRISIHEYQKRLFEAFSATHQYLIAKGTSAEHSELLHFGPHVKTASIYVTQEISDQIEQFYDACLYLDGLQRTAESALQNLRIVKAGSNVQGGSSHSDSEALMEALEQNDKSRNSLNKAVEAAVTLGKEIDKDFSKKIKLI